MTRAETDSQPTPEEIQLFSVEVARLQLFDQILQGQITQLEFDEEMAKLDLLRKQRRDIQEE